MTAELRAWTDAELAEIADYKRYSHQPEEDNPNVCAWCGEDYPCWDIYMLDALAAATEAARDAAARHGGESAPGGTSAGGTSAGGTSAGGTP